MLRVLKRFFATILILTFASQASAMFIQPDWFDPTQPGVGTNRYAYSGNDPINKMDPGGNESVVVSGSHGEEHHHDEHFLENGLSRATERLEDDPNTTWVIHQGVGNTAYSDETIAKYVGMAQEAGIRTSVVSSTGEITNYVNSKSTSGGETSARSVDPITFFSYVGHGLPEGLTPEYRRVGSTRSVGNLLLPRVFNSSAFASDARINLLATCNSANGKGSPLWQFSRILGPAARISGTVGLTDFYTPGPDTDWQLGANRHLRPGPWLRTLVTGAYPVTVHGTGGN